MSNKSQIFYFSNLLHTFIVLKTVLMAHFIKTLTSEITLPWNSQELQKLPCHFLCMLLRLHVHPLNPTPRIFRKYCGEFCLS